MLLIDKLGQCIAEHARGDARIFNQYNNHKHKQKRRLSCI